jgi:hypothetical protein
VASPRSSSSLGDEERLDGLADADVVGDEKSHRIEAKGHDERHELVGAGLKAESRERSEGTCCVSGGKPSGVSKKSAGVGVAALGRIGRAELGGLDLLETRVNTGGFV